MVKEVNDSLSRGAATATATAALTASLGSTTQSPDGIPPLGDAADALGDAADVLGGAADVLGMAAGPAHIGAEAPSRYQTPQRSPPPHSPPRLPHGVSVPTEEAMRAHNQQQFSGQFSDAAAAAAAVLSRLSVGRQPSEDSHSADVASGVHE